jgi:integrase
MSRGKPIDFASGGAVKLPIYFSPVEAKPSAGQNGGNGAPPPPEEAPPAAPLAKTYGSFVLAYYEGGRRQRRRFPTLEKAKAEGKQIAKRLALEGSQGIHLSQEECRVYVSARNILQPRNLEVDAVARLVVDLSDRLDGATLQQAVDFFNAHGRRAIVGATTRGVYEAYGHELARRGVGPHHLRDIRKFVGRFVAAFPGEIAAIATLEIDAWLARLGGKARNKNNARDAINGFFNFAQQKNFLPKGLEHAAKSTTEFRDPRALITTEEEAIASAAALDVYAPADMARILAHAQPDIRVTLEIKAFSGVRTEEVLRLWWGLIDETKGHIKISEAVAKLNHRTVPILESLKRRLAGYPDEMKQEKLCKLWGSSNALYHAWLRVARAAGVAYRRNAFRNSYISYRLALTKDINLVAYESGNSPEMIRKYYLGLVTPEQAKEWFSL